MSDTTTPGTVTPPSLPGGEKMPAASRHTAAPSLVAVLTALLLLDLAVETFLAGSPVLWTVMGVEVGALVLLALAWPRTGSTIRLAIPLAALVGLVAWVTLRLGAGADPALRAARLSLPGIALALLSAATLVAAAVPFGFAVLRRAWYLGLLFVAVAVYAAAPFLRGLVAGVPPAQVLAGRLDWSFVPAWLHGGMVAGQVVVPLGLLAALGLVARALVKRRQASWPVAAAIVLTAALAMQSSEMRRAGRSSLLDPVAAPLLTRLSSGPVAQGVSVAAPPIAPGTTASADASQSSAPAQVASGPAVPAPAGAVAAAAAGQPVANKAIELRVTGYRTAPSVGPETADPGREFVVVETAWKNIIPQQKVNRKKASDRTAGAGSLGFGGGATAQDRAVDEANSTIESVKFEVQPLSKHLWLVADGRFAEAVDGEATAALAGHLGPDKISIANFEQVVSGPVAFRAPAGAQALSILFLDAVHGHVLVPIKGDPPVLASSLGGGSRANEFVDLAVTGSSWSSAPPDGRGRTLVVGLRGISRQNALVDVPFGEFGFLQTDQGCLVQPERNAEGVTRSLAPTGRFLPFVPSEGQLAFTLPEGASPIAFLLRLQQGGPIDISLKPGARPSWPSPEATITDGDVLKVLKLPGTAVPAGLRPAPSGSDRVAVDLVVENLRSGSGIELQAGQQFRLVTPDGKRYEPSADSARAPCRLTGAAVVPAAGSRRFTMVYDVPAGQPLQLEYRGFSVKSELVKVR